MNAIIIKVQNQCYHASQVQGGLTVSELIEILQSYDDDAQVITAFDDGYTYGTIEERDIFDAAYMINDCE